MDWTEVKIEVPVAEVERAGDIAHMVVPYGIYIEDYSNLEQEVMDIARIDIIDEELIKKDRTKGIVHIYITPEENPLEAITFLKERYTAENIEHSIVIEKCVQEDWINNWKQYFNPTLIGEKLLIRPTWREEFDAKGRKVLNLDPGLAFGTGTHETTKLCLETIEKYIEEKQEQEVLDIGCGSGILSVAALLLGAKSAVGVDIDELAVTTAKENAKLNNVSEKVTILCGDLTEKVKGKYDIIIANIVADVLIKLSENVEQFMKESSIYIMSGIIDTRIDDVIDTIKLKFEVIEKIFDNGWYCVVAKKK